METPAKITEISMFSLDLPLKEPYLLSRGRRFGGFDPTFVRVETDEGLVGWGELCPWGSSYLPGFPGGVRAAVAEMAPLLIGRDPRQPEVLTRHMDRILTGHIYAKAAIDYAVWDIAAQAAGVPLHVLLGGPEAPAVPLISSIHVDSPERMLDKSNTGATSATDATASRSGRVSTAISPGYVISQRTARQTKSSSTTRTVDGPRGRRFGSSTRSPTQTPGSSSHA
jgi:L-alanine-DL-glutamate epimerase-like enolase superfamily enzyme